MQEVSILADNQGGCIVAKQVHLPEFDTFDSDYSSLILKDKAIPFY